jgi:hypothetical protein
MLELRGRLGGDASGGRSFRDDRNSHLTFPGEADSS